MHSLVTFPCSLLPSLASHRTSPLGGGGSFHAIAFRFAPAHRFALSSGTFLARLEARQPSGKPSEGRTARRVPPSEGGCGRFNHRDGLRFCAQLITEGRERKPLPPVAVSAALLICVAFNQRLNADTYRMVEGFYSLAKIKPACSAGFFANV